MEILGLLAVLLTLAMPVTIIVSLVKIARIERKVDEISTRLPCHDKKEPAREPEKTEPLKVSSEAPQTEEPEAEPLSAPAIAMPVMAAVEKPESREGRACRDRTMRVAPVATAPDADEAHGVVDLFWKRIGDWFCVRGEFAPEGVSREFAVATRWLTRVGAVLLVGAVAYFMMLAIDRGWIGPAQRVYGMMAWGVAGTLFGAWLKLKSEKYSLLGEVCAAISLAALYLSFGLGHRFFDPPVIASGYVAFAGLFAATLAAGALSIRLRSLMIACLALAGGFIVPTICSFGNHGIQLHLYLALLTIGAACVAYFRRWTAYAYAAIMVASILADMQCGFSGAGERWARYSFFAIEYALALSLAVLHAKRGGRIGAMVSWGCVAVAAVPCTILSGKIAVALFAWSGAAAIHYLVWSLLHAALAVRSRRESWHGTPVLIALAAVHAAFALVQACFVWWHVDSATFVFLCTVLAALAAEIAARSREKTLVALSIIAAIASVAVFSCCIIGFFTGGGYWGHGYASDLARRMQIMWPQPALVAFTGWRLGTRDRWPEANLRGMFTCACGMVFALLTCESHFFGRAFLPFLRGGFVTIVWTILASALLAFGIDRRMRLPRLLGLGLLALSVGKLLLADTASLATPGRVGVFASVGALLLGGAFLYLKFKSRFEEEAAR